MKAPDATDLLRSLQLWLAYQLPDPWDVQIQRSEDIERPAALITPSIPQSSAGSAYVRNLQRDYDIFVYPLGQEGQPAYSRVEAERLLTQLDRAMTQGFTADDGYRSYCMRLPTYDYSDVPYDEGLPSGSAPILFTPVSNWDIDVRVDPDDDTLFVLVVSARLEWRQDGDISRLQGALLQDITVRKVASS